MDPIKRRINVLGIESSCDDTGVAIVNQDGEILSNCVHSQLKQHLNNGGIIPMVAKEYHIEHIDRVARQALEQSGLQSISSDISAIAVSNRPGMEHCLQVGLNYARTLAKKYSKPLIPIHHMQAHALMPLLETRSIRFPFIAMLLSGGHCLLSIAKRYNDFHLLGSTIDDAPGEVLDQLARRMRIRNLGHPYDSISGGASIELLSRREGADRFKYFNDTKSLLMSGRSLDMSFSGYHSKAEECYKIVDELWRSGNRDNLLLELSHICGSLQRIILMQLVRKMRRAYSFYRMHWRYQNEDAFQRGTSPENHLGFRLLELNDEGVDLVVSGGVAANDYFTDGFRLACDHDIDPSIRIHKPTKSLCSDNGAMIAWNGLLRLLDSARSDQRSSLTSENAIVCDSDEMDSIEVCSRSPIGLDITDLVRKANFQMPRLTHIEFKTRQQNS